MKDNFLVRVDDKYEFDFSEKEVEKLDICHITDNQYHLIYEHRSYHVKLLECDVIERKIKLSLNGKVFHLKVETPLVRKIQALGINQAGDHGIEKVIAPMPGKILRVLVEEDQEVSEGDELVILEAMKMENIIKSPQYGKIQNLRAQASHNVLKNDLLLEIH